LFRIFQLGEQEIINYQNFIKVLCCSAHIGFLLFYNKADEY